MPHKFKIHRHICIITIIIDLRRTNISCLLNSCRYKTCLFVNKNKCFIWKQYNTNTRLVNCLNLVMNLAFAETIKYYLFIYYAQVVYTLTGNMLLHWIVFTVITKILFFTKAIITSKQKIPKLICQNWYKRFEIWIAIGCSKLLKYIIITVIQIFNSYVNCLKLLKSQNS